MGKSLDGWTFRDETKSAHVQESLISCGAKETHKIMKYRSYGDIGAWLRPGYKGKIIIGMSRTVHKIWVFLSGVLG